MRTDWRRWEFSSTCPCGEGCIEREDGKKGSSRVEKEKEEKEEKKRATVVEIERMDDQSRTEGWKEQTMEAAVVMKSQMEGLRPEMGVEPSKARCRFRQLHAAQMTARNQAR